MRLTDEQVSQLQQLYLEVLGRHITKQEALEQGIALVRLVKSLAKKDEDERSTSLTKQAIRK